MKARILLIAGVALFCVFVALLQVDPSAETLLRRAERAEAAGDREEAVRLASEAVERNTELVEAYYVRGRARLGMGQARQAVADLDRFVEFRPDLESRQWERGIAYYYAGQYDRGAEQFELYQTFHSSDVENAVWRFLCLLPTVGLAEARASMLPIRGDRRIPMMRIYDLYRGRCAPEDVLSAARQDSPPPEELAGRLFYVHLYLGLYHHALGESESSERYLRLAADPALAEHRMVNRIMFDVARLHTEMVRSAPATSQPAP